VVRFAARPQSDLKKSDQSRLQWIPLDSVKKSLKNNNLAFELPNRTTGYFFHFFLSMIAPPLVTYMEGHLRKRSIYTVLPKKKK